MTTRVGRIGQLQFQIDFGSDTSTQLLGQLISQDLLANYREIQDGATCADENYVDLTILSLMSDVDRWNHNPGFFKIVKETSDYYGLGMFQTGNFEVGEKELCHRAIVLPRSILARDNPSRILATHLIHKVVIDVVHVGVRTC